MLKDYVVLYANPYTPLLLETFLCQAEDSDHAEEQTLNAYPDVHEYNIVWVEEGKDWEGAQARYWNSYPIDDDGSMQYDLGSTARRITNKGTAVYSRKPASKGKADAEL